MLHVAHRHTEDDDVAGGIKSPIERAERDRSETPDERAAQLSHERKLLEEGLDDLRAGRYVEGDEAFRWLREWSAGGPAEVEGAERPSCQPKN